MADLILVDDTEDVRDVLCDGCEQLAVGHHAITPEEQPEPAARRRRHT
jgi:hypothetical protein